MDIFLQPRAMGANPIDSFDFRQSSAGHSLVLFIFKLILNISFDVFVDVRKRVADWSRVQRLRKYWHYSFNFWHCRPHWRYLLRNKAGIWKPKAATLKIHHRRSKLQSGWQKEWIRSWKRQVRRRWQLPLDSCRRKRKSTIKFWAVNSL